MDAKNGSKKSIMKTAIDRCPVCGENNSEIFIDCKDFSITRENFQIKKCKSCAFKYTYPIPTETEISRYYNSENYISHSDTKEGLVNSLYHLVRKITLKSKLKLINKSGSKGSLLDVGCGTGYFLKTCKDNGWKVMGTEPDPKARGLAEKLTENEIYSSLFQVEDLKKFNVITLWHVLEHIHLLNESLIKIKTLLQDKGTLLIAVPNSDSKDAEIYGQYWAAYDVPRHLYHFNQQSISKLINNHGFIIEKVIPMPFDAYYVSMLSEDYKGNTGIRKMSNSFINGLKSNIYGLLNKKHHSSLIYQARLKA